MSGHGPTGDYIDDHDAYLAAWDAEGEPFAAWLGWKTHAYDPAFSFLDERGRVRKVPAPVVLKVNVLLRSTCVYKGALAGCHAHGCPVHDSVDPSPPSDPPTHRGDSPRGARAPARALSSHEEPE